MDVRIFSSLLGDDWGWWKTVTLNLDRIAKLLDAGDRGIEGPARPQGRSWRRSAGSRGHP